MNHFLFMHFLFLSPYNFEPFNLVELSYPSLSLKNVEVAPYLVVVYKADSLWATDLVMIPDLFLIVGRGMSLVNCY